MKIDYNVIMSEYFKVLLWAGVLPFILSFWPPLHFYRQIRALFFSIFLIIFIFGSWDVFATFRGHWYFDKVWQIRFFKLPIEEWLFFVVIPFCCIFTWEALNYILRQLKKTK